MSWVSGRKWRAGGSTSCRRRISGNGLLCRLLDASLCRRCRGIGSGNEIDILLGELEISSIRKHIRILDIFVVERSKRPLSVSRLAPIHEFGCRPEHSDFLDKGLQRLDMAVESSCLANRLLRLLKILKPNRDSLLQLEASNIGKRRTLAKIHVVPILGVQCLETVAQRCAKVGEFVGTRISAESSNNLLPVRDICIVDDIPHILSNDRGEKPEVVGALRILGKVRILNFFDAVLTTNNSEHKCIRNAVILQANIDGFGKMTESNRPSDRLVSFRLLAGKDLEGIAGRAPLSWLRGKLREEAIRVGNLVEECRHAILLLVLRILGLVLEGWRRQRRNVLRLETQMIDERLLRILLKEHLKHLPLLLLLLIVGFLRPGIAKISKFALLDGVFQNLCGSDGLRLGGELLNLELGLLGLARFSLVESKCDELSAKSKCSTRRTLEPLWCLRQRKRGTQQLKTRLVEESIIVQCRSVLGSTAGAAAIRRLDGVDSNDTLRRGSGKEVRVDGVPPGGE